MGTWGTSIFSEDLACDVRDEYRDLIAKGASVTQAKAQMISRHGEWIADEQDGPVFWLALAASAWTLGRLDEELKQKALAIIASKTDLCRWEDPRLKRARSAALNQLAQRLQSPQKTKVNVKPWRVIGADWQLGEVVGLKLTEGDDFVLLHVVDFVTEKETNYPVVQVLCWRSPLVPPAISAVEDAAIASELHDQTLACTFVLTMRWSRKTEARVVRWGLNKKFAKHRLGWLSRILKGSAAKSPPRQYAGFGAIDARCKGASGWPLGYEFRPAKG